MLLILGGGGYYVWDRLGRPGLEDGSNRPAVAPLAAPTPPSVEEVRRLMGQGDREGALRRLHELHRQDPKDGHVAFLIGSLYFDKGWRAEALAAYGAALEADPSYRSNSALIGSLIDDLDDPQTRDKARAMLLGKIGAPARRHVEEATHTGRTPAIRQQAAAILPQLPAH
jgi:Flp pilus assembly protein TadD